MEAKVKNLYKALADFQQEVPVIHKGTEGYGYSYADLPEIFKVINPLLKKHGIGFTQPLNGSKVKTIIFHIESGEALESETDIPENVQLKGMNDFQVLGSAITYIRRYALSSILGLITDKDNDASGDQKPQQKSKNPEPQLPWLNENTEDWKKAIDYLKNGYTDKQGNHKDGSITALKKKFKISKASEEKLMEQSI